MISCLGIPKPPATVPVIIFGGFCNWSVRGGVLGFLDEEYYPFSDVMFERH